MVANFESATMNSYAPWYNYYKSLTLDLLASAADLISMKASSNANLIGLLPAANTATIETVSIK
jgi:hypothetical protein